jgi:hypothetical protein
MIRYSFWTDALERALKTAAQALIVFLGADVANVFAVDWQRAAGVAAGAAVVSLLMSIASTQVSAKGTASLAASANAPVER